MGLPVFLIFLCIWYLPILLKQGKTDRLPKKTIPLTILTVALPVFIAIILLQFGLGHLLNALPIEGIGKHAFNSYINAALVEEGIKFAFALLVIRKVKPKRKVDYVLLFGAVGMSYEIVESLLCLNGIGAALTRGIMAQHVIWQLWMGYFFYDYITEKKKGKLVTALLVPVVLHGTHDFIAFVLEDKFVYLNSDILAKMNEMQDMSQFAAAYPETMKAFGWVVALLIFLVAELAYNIITLCMGIKTAKESRKADVAAIQSNN